MIKLIAFALPVLMLPSAATAQQNSLPIIDMHMHAKGAADFGPPPVTLCIPVSLHGIVDPQCAAPRTGPASGVHFCSKTCWCVIRSYGST